MRPSVCEWRSTPARPSHGTGTTSAGRLVVVARLLAIAHGGQTLLSQATYDALEDGALPDGAALHDMASHRLKDLAQPEHVWQLTHPELPSDFPLLRSLQAFANNLPLQMTSFVGRQPEMAEIRELLSVHRLVTLTGAGGCGKSRLSLQVAAELVETYSDGVWLTELAALSDPALVPQALASTLGLQEETGRAMTEILADHLRSKSLLLLLDNCEHLIDACAALAQTLLQSCVKLRILATSREPLNVAGEKTWRVPALAVPAPEQLPLGEKDIAALLLDYDGPRLFVERARLHSSFALNRSNVAAVAQICSRLDGIPLAIELAAARVRSLSVEEVNARLDNRFRLLTGGLRTALPRQQTLRALIDWSYDLLTEQEKTALRRLSVFAGGWTLAAAETVCAGEGIEEWETLDLLTSLADKSLVTAETEANSTHYRLLETVRQYGADRLAEGGEGQPRAGVTRRGSWPWRSRRRRCCVGRNREHGWRVWRPSMIICERRWSGANSSRGKWRPVCVSPVRCGGSGRCMDTFPRGGSGWAGRWRVLMGRRQHRHGRRRSMRRVCWLLIRERMLWRKSC